MRPTLPRRAVLPLVLLAAPALRAAPARGQAQPSVVASFSILGDLVAQVAPDRVALRVIAGPETDAHAFQPRPSDAEAVRGAALVVRNGLGFEPWLDRLLRSTGYRGPVATATEGLTPRRADPDPAHGRPGDTPDPHAWQDVGLARSYARTIAAALAAADPSQAAAHRAAGEAFAARLGALDAWVRAELARVPPARRVVITSHAAFGYFGDAYGIRILAPQGVTAEAQPSARQVAALIRQVRAEGVTAVFIEGQGSQAVMGMLARDAGIPLRGRLYADTLSPPDGPAPTYEALVRHNVGLMVPAMLGA